MIKILKCHVISLPEFLWPIVYPAALRHLFNDSKPWELNCVERVAISGAAKPGKSLASAKMWKRRAFNIKVQFFWDHKIERQGKIFFLTLVCTQRSITSQPTWIFSWNFQGQRIFTRSIISIGELSALTCLHYSVVWFTNKQPSCSGQRNYRNNSKVTNFNR